MSASRERDLDAGMRAVARVRSVREQDARLGLARAAADELEAVRRLDAVRRQLGDYALPTATDPVGLAHGRRVAGAMAAETTLAERGVASAATITGAARDHWQLHRTRLEAVELLLERRVETRRAERRRRETAETDDLVASRWLRAKAAVTVEPIRGDAP